MSRTTASVTPADLPETATDRMAVPWRVTLPVVTGLVLGVLVIGFEAVYANKAYPGVRVNGVYVGGLSRPDLVAQLNKATTAYQASTLTLAASGGDVTVPVAQLGTSYDNERAADNALRFGRQGGLANRLHQQLRALVGRSTVIQAFTYDDAKLAAAVNPLIDAQSQPVSNARLTTSGGQVQVTPSRSGSRLDLGELVALVEDRLGNTDTSAVAVSPYALAPSVDTASLNAAKGQAETYLKGPLTLTYLGTTKTVGIDTLATWLTLAHSTPVGDLLGIHAVQNRTTVSLDHAAVAAFVGSLAKGVDQAAQNAALTVTDGQVTVFQPNHDGRKLDQDAAVKAITAALAKPADDRLVAVNVATVKADVTADSLNNLGLKELISEGVSYFPGSSNARITNVRAGASKFNNLLIKPGEKFSFNKYLGEVSAATGYVPELVILAGTEEKQYGGGLCQVSSTAYRAALLAGLPINARTNHSFAVSYYTAPFGVPGVDATIYLPAPDMQFTNDTGSYILIQTQLTGTTLKFDFYGTKTKSGQIRGPFFVSGSNDATQPSHTVFYRDVLDLGGKVTKTDTVNTYYQSSKDFTIVR